MIGIAMAELFTFFMAFVENPLQVGSLIPSSRHLLRRVVDAAGVRTASTIVELGPGNGCSTRAILQSAPEQARLLSIEVNSGLYELVRNIDDKRVIAHQGNAGQLLEIISRYSLGPPDAVISGIPFSTMKATAANALLKDISTVLAPGGRFVAYQLSKRVATLARPFLGIEHMEVELLNIPPMRVYRWVKNSDSG